MLKYLWYFISYFSLILLSVLVQEAAKEKIKKSLVEVSAKLKFALCDVILFRRPSRFLSLSWDDGVKTCTFLSKRRSAEKWSQLSGSRCLVGLYYIQATGNDWCLWKRDTQSRAVQGVTCRGDAENRRKILLGDKADKIASRNVLTRSWNK